MITKIFVFLGLMAIAVSVALWMIAAVNYNPNDIQYYDEEEYVIMIKYPYLERWIYDHGLTMRKAAKLFDMSYSCVIGLLEGRGNPKKDTIDKLIGITGMPYEQLFAETVSDKWG